MFYCAQSLKRQVFFIEDCGAAAVAEPMDGELLCYDVYGKTKRPLNDIRYYYLPLPYDELQKNPNLKNNKGW